MLKYKIHIFISLLLVALCTRLSGNQVAPQDTIGLRHVFAKLVTLDRKFFHRKALKQNIKVDSLLTRKKLDTTLILKNNIKVFGWHTYWSEDSYKAYDYNLLTHVAYFSCSADVNTGRLATLNGWDTSSLVSYVHAQNPNCKVVLTFACFGQKTISTLLNNKNAQKRVIEDLVNAVTKKKADGICLDFEGIPDNQQNTFTSFVSQLKKACEKGKLSISMTLPAINTNPSPYNFDSLKTYVDLFLIMGYDYFGSFSKTYAGPSAPSKVVKNWISSTVEQSVNYYLNTKISNTQLLLAVPYYGAIWETENINMPSKIKKFIGYRPYSYALAYMANFKNDSAFQLSYYAFPVKDSSSTFREFYLDTEYSLGLKYDLILNKKLAGVGIWALGYDAGTNELWQLLQNKFSNKPLDNSIAINPNNMTIDTCKCQTDSIQTHPSPPMSLLSVAQQILSLSESKPTAFRFVISFLLLTLWLVIFKVVKVPNNHAQLKTSGLFYLFYFILLILGLLLLSVFIYCFHPHTLLTVFILVGIVLFAYFIKKLKGSKTKTMP